MKRNFILIATIILLLIPLNIYALSDKYIDKVSPITGNETNSDKVSLYLFKGAECPHCAEEKEWLEEIKEDYKDYLDIYEYEVWHNEENAKYYEKVKETFKSTTNSVPFTVIGKDYYIGFSETTASKIENNIKEYAGLKTNPNHVKIPILGDINMKKAMTLTYEVGENLYINVTNRCSCACTFCIRKNDDGAYGSDPLWLEHEPTIEEMQADLRKRDLRCRREDRSGR